MKISNPIILFDGECNLCNGWVTFIIERDPKAKFRFASLQSDWGRNFLKEAGLSTAVLSSIVLVENGGFSTQSNAVLKIFKLLGLPWSMFYGFILVPKPIRNRIYDLVSKNRYKWWGKRETCMIPTPELKKRFIS